MARFELLAFGTESCACGFDVRFRDYTTSAKKAALFDKVPKIQFTDSGHGIVFSVRELRRSEKKKARVGIWDSIADYVREHIAAREVASIDAELEQKAAA